MSSKSNLQLGLPETDPFWDLLEGRKKSRSGEQPKSSRGGSVTPSGQPASKGKASRARLSQTQRIAKLLRVANKAPEVMVKVTGRDSTIKQLRGHLAYLGREEDAQAELSDGQVIQGREAIREISDLIPDLRDPENEREAARALALHVMFSMPAGTATGVQVRDAAREVAQHIFRGHEYAMVLHEDKPHKHVHMVVSMTSDRGRQLRHYKPQLQQWRESFAQALRARGVVAEATPRVVRGVGERGVNRSVRAIRDQRRSAQQNGDPMRKAARTDTGKVVQLLRELEGEGAGKGMADRPWEKHLVRQRETVEAGWAKLQTSLREGGVVQQGQAQLIAEFTASMPRSETYRDRQLRTLDRLAAIGLAKDRDRER